MTEKGFITANSGDTDVAGTLSIAAPRALYAVASGHKPKKNPEELLPASPADRGSGIRLIKSEDRKKDDIINRPGRSTYPREKSVLTSGATCLVLPGDADFFQEFTDASVELIFVHGSLTPVLNLFILANSPPHTLRRAGLKNTPPPATAQTAPGSRTQAKARRPTHHLVPAARRAPSRQRSCPLRQQDLSRLR